MTQLVVSEYVTLNGAMEAPNVWTPAFWNDEVAQYKRDELFAADGLLLSRVTYEGFAAAWPSMTDEEGFADRMNSFPKYVITETLDELEWNNSSVVNGDDLVAEVERIKGQAEQDSLVFGSAELVDALRAERLVDEYRIMVFPVIQGNEKRLFERELETNTLELIKSETFGSGVVVLSYRPAPEDDDASE